MLEFVLRRSTLVAVVVAGVLNVGIASASAISVSTTPSNYPTFSSSVSDYVISNCPTTGVSVNVTTDTGQSVSVDNQTPQTGTFSATVNVTTGQEFSIVETNGSTTTGTWYMRCLPSDFPDFTSSVTGTPQAQFYVAGIAKPGATEGYATFFDDNGVPVWWYATVPRVDYVASVPTSTSGYVGWTSGAGGDTAGNPVPVITLDGQSVHTYSSPDGPIDLHEFQPLGHGNVLVEVDETRSGVNLSSWGSGWPTNATIQDPVVEELSPTNKVLYRWDPYAHINPVIATNPEWYSFIQSNGSPYDVFHMNSLSLAGGVLLISFRHLDAIYSESVKTGRLVMKIGGNKESESYTVANDPVFATGGTFCGQHDARIVGTNLITLHDNGTNCGRAPRGVEYSLNPSTKTATLVTQVTDPRAPSSFCCGSARLLPGGDWVADWGSNPFFTELTSTGSPVLTVNWTDSGAFAYRVTPVLPGSYTSAELRAAMNTMFPRAAHKQ